jgi:hypothetical protein
MPIFAMPFIAAFAFSRFGLIALVVLGFMIWWPLGLAALAFGFGSGRMGCGMHGQGPWNGRWENRQDRWAHKMERMQRKMDWMRGHMGGGSRGTPWGGSWGGSWGGAWGGSWGTPSSGNHAFDEYRNDTLKRLEEEQREFREFLERLRFAKDKTEFDQFMAERRDRPAPETPPQQN